MRRRGAVKLILLLLILALAAAAVAAWMSQEQGNGRHDIRNVVLISIDTCRADHLSCYGFKRNTTPNIDALAADGVMFWQAQSTNPLTLPAHSSMMTGTIPPVHGVLTNLGHRLGESNVTLAEVLRDEGFQTGAVVGAFPMEGRFGMSQGFDSYDDEFGSDPKAGLFNERSAEQVSQAATSWLEQQKDAPFFLFLHYFDPHQQYSPPEPFATEYPRDKYSGEIAYTDHCIGKVIDKLKQLGLYESTAIIITSDHGESLGDHKENTHGFFIYQPTIRIPLVVRTPECEKGRKVGTAVSVIDVMPTVLGMLGMEVPDAVQGIDLTDCIHGGPEPTSDRFLYSDTWYPAKLECCPLRGVLHGKWRYIWSVRPELYDLAQDPGETKNVYAEYPAIAQTLDDRLQEMLATAELVRSENYTESLAPDEQTRQRLQSLGYVGGSTVESLSDIDEDMNDPKDYIRILNQFTTATDHKSARRWEEAKAECLKIMAVEPRMLHAHLMLAEIATAQGDAANARKHYDDVLAIAAQATRPDTLGYEISIAHTNLGQLSLQIGKSEEAKRHFQQVLNLDPNHIDSLMGLAAIYLGNGQNNQAAATLEHALRLQPDLIDAINDLAWLLATTSDPTLHNPAKALNLARRAAELSARRRPSILDTLAVAQAAAGDFPAAIATAEEAVSLAEAEKQTEVIRQIRQRLELFRQSIPYRQPPSAGQ